MSEATAPDIRVTFGPCDGYRAGARGPLPTTVAGAMAGRLTGRTFHHGFWWECVTVDSPDGSAVVYHVHGSCVRTEGAGTCKLPALLGELLANHGAVAVVSALVDACNVQSAQASESLNTDDAARWAVLGAKLSAGSVYAAQAGL